MAAGAMLKITKTGAFAMACYTLMSYKGGMDGVTEFQEWGTNHQRILFSTESAEAARETRCDQWAEKLLTKG